MTANLSLSSSLWLNKTLLGEINKNVRFKNRKKMKNNNDIGKILDQVQLSFHIKQGMRQEVLFKKKNF